MEDKTGVYILPISHKLWKFLGFLGWLIWLYSLLMASSRGVHGASREDVISQLKESPHYRFSIKDFDSYFEKLQTHQFALISRPSGWDLYFIPEGDRVISLALEELKSFHKKKDKAVNRILLSNWILGFDPQSVSASSAHTTKTKNKQQQFVLAWNEFRLRYYQELKAAQSLEQMKGRNSSIEAYVPAPLIQKALQSFVSDGQSFSFIETALKSAAALLKKTYSIPLNTDFKFEMGEQSFLTRINGKLDLTPDFDPQELSVQVEQVNFSRIDFTQDVQLAQISLQLPYKRIVIQVPTLRIESQTLTKPFEIKTDDQVQIVIENETNQKLSLKGALIWDSALQRPDFSLRRNSIDMALSAVKIKSVYFKGRRYDMASQAFDQIFGSEEGWGFIKESLDRNPFKQALLGFAAQKLSEVLSGKVSYQQSFVAIDTSAENVQERFKLLPYDPQNPETDPSKNLQIISKFSVDVPFHFNAPKLNLSALEGPSKFIGSVRANIQNPQIELQGLQIFHFGRRVSNNDLGLRIHMKSNEDESLWFSGEAQAQIKPNLDLNLKEFKTNFDQLSVDKFDVRLGSKWLQTDKVETSLLVSQGDFFRSQLAVYPYRKQAPLGIELQGMIENEIRKEMSARLAVKQIPLDINYQKKISSSKLVEDFIFKVRGVLKAPYLRPDQINLRFRDHSKSAVKCHGTYLVSADTYINIADPVQVTGEDLGLTVRTQSKKILGLIKVKDLSASVYQPKQKATELRFDFDLCLKPSQNELDIQVRDLKHNLDQILFTKVQLRGISYDFQSNMQQKFLGFIESFLGSSKGYKRDEMTSRFVESILDGQSGDIASAIREVLEEYLRRRVPYYLQSPKVKMKLEKGFLTMRKAEDDLAHELYMIGSRVQKPLEEIIVQQAQSNIQKYLPLAEQTLKQQMSLINHTVAYLGSKIGSDITDLAYVQLVKAFYGEQSEKYFLVALERLIKNAAGPRLFAQNSSTEKIAKESSLWMKQIVSDLPVPCEEISASAFKEKIQVSLKSRYSSFSIDTINGVSQLMVSQCYKPTDSSLEAALEAPSAQSKSLIEDLISQGMVSINDLLMREALQKYLSPAQAKLPVFNQASKSTKGFSYSGWKLHSLELLRAEDTKFPSDVFVLRGVSEQISNGWGHLEPQSAQKIRSILNESGEYLVLRLPLETTNQILHEIDWKALIRETMKGVLKPHHTIEISKVPQINEKMEISAGIRLKAPWMKAQLIVSPLVSMVSRLFKPRTPIETLEKMAAAPLVDSQQSQKASASSIDFSDISRFTLSLFDLTNFLGLQAKFSGSIPFEFGLQAHANGEKTMELKFSQPKVEELKASAFLSKPIRKRIDDIDDALNRSLNLALQKMGGLPEYTWLGHKLSVEDIRWQDGDFYLICGFLSPS